MGKYGFRVLDADTHVYEPIEIIEKYLPASAKEALARLPVPVGRLPLRGGLHIYNVGNVSGGERRLGTREKAARPSASAQQHASGAPWGVRWKGPEFPSERVNVDPHARIADMDIEGVDVHVIIPTRGVNGFVATDDVRLEVAMYEAYHRYMADYCAPYPARLKSVVLVGVRDLDASLAELDRCAREPWPVAVFPITPVGFPLDDPALDRLWARAVEHDLAVLIHPFNLAHPRSPGLGDLWDSIYLQRACGGVWAGMRAVATVTACGVLDRFPALRIGVVETGHGWLASWAFHLDEVAEMTRYAIAPIARKPSEYIRGPQYFHSIELHEGEGTVRSVIELLGPDTLMLGTDYPHTESWFPKSVETVVGWTTLSDDAKRKLLWDNAAALYRRCGS
jgi:predicted TIM-barrel fold metal-dependent hydrolase